MTFTKVGILTGWVLFVLPITTVSAQTGQANLAVIVRHAPNLNGGTIQGSVQQLNGEGVNVNSGFVLTGDFLLPGTPTLRLNGNPVYSGTITGSGSTAPAGYLVTLNSGCSLRYLLTRTTPIALSTVSAPPAPAGTRSVNINTVGQSYGDAATLRDLTLNGNVGLISLPPGTYGNFNVSGGSGLVLGVAGGLQAVSYNLQNANFNSGSTLKIVGPVVLTVANGFTANGLVGASNNPNWLQLRVASGGLTLNSGSSVSGLVQAPNGTVIVNGNSRLIGTSASDQFILNSGGVVCWGGASSPTTQAPTATVQNITLAENGSTNLILTGTDPLGGTLTFTLLTTPAHGTISGTPPVVTYQPTTNFFGSDSFNFKVNNGITDSAPATISLTVNQVFYQPTALSQSLVNLEDTALPVTLAGYDPQGYSLAFSVLTQPAHGTLTGTAPNLAYRPVTNYFGNDSFTFRVSNGYSNSVAASISITNQPVDDLPLVVAGPDRLIILPVNAVSLTGSVSFDAFPGAVDTVMWSKVSGPGSVTFSNPTNTLTTATFSQSGIYRLRLFASDSFLSDSSDLSVTVNAPPLVSAGGATTNIFPGTVVLSGTASDDGLPTNGVLTTLWSLVSGPGTVVFGNASVTNTSVTFGTNGMYVLRLTADDGVATNHAEVAVIENLPPAVNAGSSILTNGLNANLNASVADDGWPSGFLSVQWSQSSGPGTVTFGDATATNSSITASQSGTYVLVLTATDSSATDSSEVTVTLNQPPVVTAGLAQTVNTGVTVTLAGMVSDDQLPHDTLTSLWTKVNGPGSVIFADASLTNTTVTFDQPGVYTLRLTASDTLATAVAEVVVRVNAAPVVLAGNDQVVTLGAFVTLTGSFTDDGIPGSSVATLWSQISGPAGAVVADPSAAKTTVSFTQSGGYMFQLAADDGLTNGHAQVMITVDQAPVVTAGTPVLINWPANQTVLRGTVADDGLPNGGTLTSDWSQLGGPAAVNLSMPSATSVLNGSAAVSQPETAAVFTAPGLYTLRLTGDDGVATNHADVVVTVNQAPAVSAGASQSKVMPGSLLTLNGTATDDGLPTGSVLTTVWSKVSGPGTVTFGNVGATNSTASFDQTGVYVLRLSANDSVVTTTAVVTLTVTSSNQPPVVTAGSTQTNLWSLPVHLSGTVTDDGMPSGTEPSTTWSVISGPAGAVFDNTSLTNATVMFSRSGVYVLQLVASDSQLAASNQVVIIADAAPLVTAGTDLVVTDTNQVSLNGMAIDDGLPLGTLTGTWSLVSGPGTATFQPAVGTNALTGVTETNRFSTAAVFSTTGVYVLSLTVDDGLVTNAAQVVITVNQSPLIDAGSNQTVQLGQSASLQGLVADDGLPAGGSLAIGWSLASGPGTVMFDDQCSPETSVRFNMGGVYVFRLAASDGAATNYSDTTITVTIPNRPPFVQVGPKQIIVLPAVADLAASISDDGFPVGSTLNVAWSKVSGPGVVTFVNSASAITTASFSEAGNYVLRLVANDTELSSHADLSVIVRTPAMNLPPVVSAGQNKVIGLTSQVRLAGTVTDDGLPQGAPITVQWSEVSGPGGVTFENDSITNAVASFSALGTYTLRLTANDSSLSASNEVQVTVYPFNQPPIVDAGTNQTIVIPDPDVLIANGILPTNPSVTLCRSLLSVPHWSNAVGQPGLDQTGTYRFEPGAVPPVVSLSWSGTRLVASGSFVVTGTNFIGSVATWDGTNWSGLFDDTVPCQPVQPYPYPFLGMDVPFGCLAWQGEEGYGGNGSAVYLNTSRGNEVFVNGGFLATRHMDQAQETLRWDGSRWDNWGVQGGVPYFNPRQMVTTSNMVYELFDVFKPTYQRSYVTHAADPLWPDCWATNVSTSDLADMTNCYWVATWDGTNWGHLGDLQQIYLQRGQVQSITVGHHGEVYIGGDFSLDTPTGVANCVAVWDGTNWGPLGAGISGGQPWVDYVMPAYVLSLTMDELGNLYAVGPFSHAGGIQVNGSAKWDGTKWSKMGDGIGWGAKAVASYGRDIFVSGGALYATGLPQSFILRWDGQTWNTLGQGVDLSVGTLAAGPNGVFMAGTFTSAGGQPATNVAYWEYPPLPSKVAYLNGKVSDDGLPVGSQLSLAWNKISGTGDVYFGDIHNPVTTASFSKAGTYVLRLSASDGEFTSTDDTTVIVHGNEPPVVDAGTNQVLALDEAAFLTGTVSDDGLPEAAALHQQWTMFSGPGKVQFEDPSNPQTAVTFSQPGAYVLRLSANDSQFTVRADVTIQVLPQNAAPGVGVLSDFVVVTQPNQATLHGSCSDDGWPTNATLTSFWSQVSGPGTVSFGTAQSADTTVQFPQVGTYVIRYTASDSELSSSADVTVWVLPPTGSQSPAVVAGSDQQITLPASILLNGTIITNGVGGVTQVAWQALSGPGPVTFADPNLSSTTASFSAPGVYRLQLEFDLEQYYYGWPWWNAVAADQLYVVVNPPTGVNQAPVVYAGSSRTVALGAPVPLRGLAADDGLPAGILGTQWELVDGPADVQFANSNALTSTVIFTNAGQYNLQLRASDSELESVSGVSITVVNPSDVNQPPVVDAGADQSPEQGNSVQLQGVVTDDGLPAGVLNHVWEQISGPGTVTFGDPGALETLAAFSDSGQYLLGLRADDGRLVSEDYVVIHIDHALNQPPTVDAGPVQLIKLPDTSVTLNGTVTDDGLPTGGALHYHWEVADAPGEVVFADTNSLTTTVDFPNPPLSYYYDYIEPMPYRLRLVADDSVFSVSNEVTIILVDPKEAKNPLTASAGSNQTIMLPSTAMLDGWRSYSTEYGRSTWRMVSGPGTVTFDQDWSLQTAAHFSKPGNYVLRLMIFEYVLRNSADVTITVLAPTNHWWVETGPALSLPILLATNILNGSVQGDSVPTNGTLATIWSVLSGPGQVTFANASAPATAASFDAVGSYVLRLTASDSVATNSSDLFVKVYDPAGLLTVDAGADQSIILPQTAVLNGVVLDYGVTNVAPFLLGGLAYSWSVGSGPFQVDFDDSSLLHTTARFYIPGDYVLTLSVSDGVLASSADVHIHVGSTDNQPPVLFLDVPAPVASGVVATFNGYVVDDGRPAGGVLDAHWSEVSGPGTVTFLQASNDFPHVSTQASFAATGDYVLQLVANDGGMSSTGQVTVSVFNLYNGNQAPVVSAGPARSATTRLAITLAGSAADDGLPAGSQLSTLWSMLSGPVPVRFGNTSETNTAATFYLPGTYVLQLVAVDGQRSTASQVTIVVNDPTNTAPLVYVGTEQTVTRPAAAWLDGTVIDDDLPLGYPVVYQWTKVSGPGTVAFATDVSTNLNDSGWNIVSFFDASVSATFSAAGTYLLRLTASDSEFTNTDEVSVNVLPGVNSAPVVDAGTNQSITLPNEAVLYTGVTDDGLPQGILRTTWSLVSGPGPVAFKTVNGIYHASFGQPGAYMLRLTASDGELSSSNEMSVAVYGVTPAPVARIDDPLDGDIITAPTPVIGTASSPILQSYQLQYRLKTPDEDNAWAVFAHGSSSVVSNTLGVLDPTLMLNGIYEVKLVATDISGRTTETTPMTVVFDRNLKIGNFTLSFNDLSVPVPGLPIQITRTYDSRAAAAGVLGDFGAGWTMDIRNVRLQKNRPLSRNWEETATGSADDLSMAYFLNPGNPRYVTITFPDGRVEKFQFTPNPMSQALSPIAYPQWNFTPVGNTPTNSTLVPASFDDPDGNFLFFAGSIPGIADLYDLNYFSDWVANSATEAELYRYPTLFRYTSAEGYRYLIDEVDGLQSVTDPNGNTLTVATNGLDWSNPNAGTNRVAVAFQRDDFGRITNIMDLAGNSLRYQYDTNGNLVTFTDRVGQTNGFAYTNTNFPHYLTSITDAGGITAVQNRFDTDGRLIGSLDAIGNAINYGHDLVNNREYVTNRLGAVTIREYDNHGNVTRLTDPLGLVTSYTYDDNGNLLSEGKGTNQPRIYAYDANDNRTSEIDELGRTSYYTYNGLRKVLTATDLDGHTTTNSYNASGNLVATRDSLGNTFTFGNDQLGNVLSMTDPQGHITRYTYDALGHLSSETDPQGNVVNYIAGADGKLLNKTRSRVVSSVQPKTLAASLLTKSPAKITRPVALNATVLVTNITTYTFKYDASGNLVALGNDLIWETNVYDNYSRIIKRIDALNRSTIVEHNTNGLVSRITHPGDIIETFDYDAENHLINYVDGMGRVTKYTYNARGAIISVLHPDGRVVSSTYNNLGQLATESDFSGITTYAYDPVGNRISIVDHGRTATYEYNAKRACTKYTDFAGRTMVMEYDFLNRNTKVTYPDNTTRSATYFGKLVASITDQLNHTTQYDYDGNGRLLSVTDPLGHATSYTYDGIGNRLTESDPLGRVTTYAYDGNRSLTGVSMPDGSTRSGTYDAGGRLLSQTDGEQKTTLFEYDDANNLITITDPAQQKTEFTYNKAHQRTSRTDPEDSNHHRPVTTWTYDGYGHLQETRYPDNTIETMEYDGNSRLLASTDRSGHRSSYGYDDFDHVKSVSTPAGITSFTYDPAGNRTSLTDVAGHATGFDYDKMNRMVRIHFQPTLQNGPTELGFDYDSAGRLKSQTDQMGFVTQFEYDNANRKIVTIDPQLHEWHYDFDACNQLHSILDPTNHITINNYDQAGRLIETIYPDLSTSTKQYDKRGLVLQSTDQLRQTTRYTYDDLGRVKTATDPLGGVTQYEHDEMGRVTELTDPKGQTTFYSYDVMGNRTRVITPDAATRSCTYDAAGHVLTETDPLNHTTTYSYDFVTGKPASIEDALHHKTRFFYNNLGQRTSMLDALNRETSYEYDVFGHLTRITHPDSASESFTYDNNGRLIKATDALDHSTAYDYDKLGQLISKTDMLGRNTSYGYDSAGRRVSVTDPVGHQTTFGYDAVGNVTGIAFADGTSVSRTYDFSGRVLSVTDQKYNTTRFDYDALGHLTKVNNALGGATGYTYDELGRMTAQTDALNRVTQYEYDPVGRRTKRTLPSGVFESNTYDLAGNLTQRKDFNGLVTSREYDEINRLIAEKTNAIPQPFLVAAYSYNEVSVRTGMSDLSGSTSYTYDLRDRLLTKTRSWNDTGTAAILKYGYDLVGNVTSVYSDNHNGAAMVYGYDAIYRLTDVTDGNGATRYHYDLAGNMDRIIHPNSVIENLQFDSLNRVASIVATNLLAMPTLLSRFASAYDPAGNRIGADESVLVNGQMKVINHTYDYDAGSRLTDETITVSNQLSVLNYTYDAVGNRLTRSSTQPVLPPLAYSYDSDDRLTSDQYDANGNTVVAIMPNAQQQPVSCYDDYDYADRLTQRKTTLNGQSVTLGFQYDGDGQRVGKTVNGVTTHFLVDDINPTGYPQVLEEHAVSADPNTPPTVTGVYTYGNGPLSQDQWNNGQWQTRHFGRDAHGSVRLLTDAAGHVTDTYDYDAFGNLTAQTPTDGSQTPNTRLFAGEEFDPDLGLQYLRARYQDPQRGRFWTRDSFEGSLGNPASQHAYAYCQNDPVNGVDPSGHETMGELSMSVGIHAIMLPALLNVWSGTMGTVYGLTETELTKALNQAEAMMIQGTAQSVGVMMGLNNYWNTVRGAPFLLAANPFVAPTPSLVLAPVVIGFDQSVPLYGAGLRNSVLEAGSPDGSGVIDPVWAARSGLQQTPAEHRDDAYHSDPGGVETKLANGVADNTPETAADLAASLSLANRATDDNRAMVALQLPKGAPALTIDPMIVSVSSCTPAIWNPGAYMAKPHSENNPYNVAGWTGYYNAGFSESGMGRYVQPWFASFNHETISTGLGVLKLLIPPTARTFEKWESENESGWEAHWDSTHLSNDNDAAAKSFGPVLGAVVQCAISTGVGRAATELPALSEALATGLKGWLRCDKGGTVARLAIREELTATSARAAERFLTAPGLCTENKILGEGALASHEAAVVAQREAIGLETAQRMAAKNTVKSAAAEGAGLDQAEQGLTAMGKRYRMPTDQAKVAEIRSLTRELYDTYQPRFRPRANTGVPRMSLQNPDEQLLGLAHSEDNSISLFYGRNRATLLEELLHTDQIANSEFAGKFSSRIPGPIKAHWEDLVHKRLLDLGFEEIK